MDPDFNVGRVLTSASTPRENQRNDLDRRSIVTVGGGMIEWLCHFWRLAEIASYGVQREPSGWALEYVG